MKKGTKIGWLLIAVSIVMSVWVIVSQSATADTSLEDGFIVADEDNTRLIGYTGAGGNITIPAQIRTIDAGVFANNASITSVTMSAVESMGMGVFKGCANLQSISLGETLNAIPSDTFWECQSLSSVTIPASVTSIGQNAFYGCASLPSISIPASVTALSTDAFRQCANLSNISVARGTFTSADGCVYNSSGTRLLIVPEGKTSVSISAGTKEIASGAFLDCSGVASLSIPNGATTIESNAFSGSGIDTITIPASVTSIGAQSNWVPSTIYGYADTAAENYAMTSGVLFEVIGNDDSQEDPENGENDENNDNKDNNDNNNSDNDKNDKDDKNSDTTDNTDKNNTTPAGGGTNPPTATGGQGTTNTTGSAHIKDATPTTADGIDSRYFLCFAIFAGGVGVILYSKFNKMRYVSERTKNR